MIVAGAHPAINLNIPSALSQIECDFALLATSSPHRRFEGSVTLGKEADHVVL